MPRLTKKYKLPFLRGGTGEISFNDQLKLREWMKGAKSVHMNQKRRATSTALKEFRDLYEPIEWYCAYPDEEWYRDDAIEIFYKTKEMIRNGVRRNPEKEYEVLVPFTGSLTLKVRASSKRSAIENAERHYESVGYLSCNTGTIDSAGLDFSEVDEDCVWEVK